MRFMHVAVVTITVLASLASGLSKQLEAPLEAAAFKQAGLPVEILSLYGAVEFVLTLLLLFPKPRPVAAVALASLFAHSTFLLWPLPMGWLMPFNAVMVPLVLLAGFWRFIALRKDPEYMGAIPLGFSNTRR